MPKTIDCKVVLVGEQNPYGPDPEFALYPAPEGSSGHRLCCQILMSSEISGLRVRLAPGSELE